MIRNEPNCKVCQTILKKPALVQEIYNTTYFTRTARRKISEVQRKYSEEFSYESITRHLKNGHQTLSAQQIKDRNMKDIAKKSSDRIVKKTENIKAGVVWDSVIGEGMRRLTEGEMEMKVSDLLKATKDKSDYELKVKDQELAMAEMVAYFASGEGDVNESRKYDARIIEGQTAEYFDPAAELTAGADRRAQQSRSFYQSLVGDATSPRAD